MTNHEPLLEFIEDKKVIRRLFYWGGLALFACALMFGPYKLTRVDGVGMGPELSRTEFYVTVKPNKICISDLVQVVGANKEVLVRSVAALEGSTLSLNNNGYKLNGIDFVMSERWVTNAESQFDQSKKITIPDKHVLLMRTDPDANPDNKYESFKILEAENIKRRFSRVVTSFVPSRIGYKLRSTDVAPSHCQAYV